MTLATAVKLPAGQSQQLPYTVLWNAFKRIALGRNATEEELTALFGGTAKRVYKIGEHAPEPEE